MNTPFRLRSTSLRWIRLFFEKEQDCSEYDFRLKRISLQWIRICFERYMFAVNTTFVWTVTDFSDEYDFCLRRYKVCSEYAFCLHGTSLQMNTTFLWKVQICSEIRLFFEMYKFAVNTTYLWKVQSLQMNTTFVKKGTIFAVNTPFGGEGTSLRWIRLFCERNKFAVNTTFD